MPLVLLFLLIFSPLLSFHLVQFFFLSFLFVSPFSPTSQIMAQMLAISLHLDQETIPCSANMWFQLVAFSVSIYLSVRLSLGPSVHPSVRPSVGLLVHPSFRPSIGPSVHLFVCYWLCFWASVVILDVELNECIAGRTIKRVAGCDGYYNQKMARCVQDCPLTRRCTADEILLCLLRWHI